MGKTFYITAIELSSSKISGAVGVETLEGIKILATASTPVDGFITKGVVRNVDETSRAITNIINMLEHKLGDNYKVNIKRAYTSLGGLSLRSVKSKVTNGFDDYTRISSDIITDLALENDETFQCPAGYKKIPNIRQEEYRLDGKIDNNPVGASAKIIEGNFLNLIMKEQYIRQLEDSFNEADLMIAESFSAAHIDADILLDKDARRNGCALVNIGADTTTISIYTNGILRMLNVLPLGSSNITKDLCAEYISYDEAEEIKITRGYKPENNENGYVISTETANNIIYARMGEILQNVKYRIEESDERVNHIIFTGGGSKLKNIGLLFEEFLPNFKTDIVSEPKFNLISDSGVNINVVTTTLYGLLKQGRENCCEEEVKEAPKVIIQPDIFGTEDIFPKVEEPEIPKEPEEFKVPELSKEEKKRIEREEKEKRKEEERIKKEEERIKKEEERKRKAEEKIKRKAEKNKRESAIGSFIRQLFDQVTEVEDNVNDND